jgi:hypothetical protein
VALAFKVEEQHQRMRLVLRCSRDVMRVAGGGDAPLDSAAFNALHQRVVDAERCLLYTLEFDVGVSHPYRFIQATLVAWKEAGVFEGVGWARAARNSSAPRELRAANLLARNLAFQLLATGAPLRYTPPELAAAALTLALDVVFAGGGAAVPPGLAALAAAPPASPVRAEHLALCAGLEGAAGARAVWELREEAPGALAPYAMGDSAVRACLGLHGGVAPVPAAAGEAGSGSGGGGGVGGATPRASPPAGRGGGGGGGGGGGAPAAAKAAPPPAGPPPAEDMEDGLAPQLAPTSPE